MYLVTIKDIHLNRCYFFNIKALMANRDPNLMNVLVKFSLQF